MLKQRLLLFLAICLALATACGTDDTTEDRAGDTQIDVSFDADGSDSAVGDAEDDAEGDADTDDDECAAVGCALPPICGEDCSAMCGCCSCGEGDGYCDETGDVVQAVNCDTSEGCFLTANCGEGTRCTTDDGLARCVPLPVRTCADIEEDYARLVSENEACIAVSDCQVLNGQCGTGLGGCYETVNVDLTQPMLSALGAEYQELGCTSAVCDCAEAPELGCLDGTCGFVE